MTDPTTLLVAALAIPFIVAAFWPKGDIPFNY